MDISTFLGRLFKQQQRGTRSSGQGALTTFFGQYDTFMVEATVSILGPTPTISDLSAVITDFFLENNTKWLVGELFTIPAYIAVGTGVVATGDPRSLTALVGEVDRVAATVQSIGGGPPASSLTIASIRLDTPPIIACTWTEIGLLDSAGVLMSRVEDADGIYTKAASPNVTIYWYIQPVFE